MTSETYKIILVFFVYIFVMFVVAYVAWFFIASETATEDKWIAFALILFCLIMLAWGAGIV